MVIYNKELSKKHKAVKKRIREKNKDSTYIPYPTEPSETDIVHHLLNKFQDWGLDALSEISSKDGTSRFDIVIFKNKVAQRIIEVKKKSGLLTENQKEKYSKYKIPVDYVRGKKGANKYLKTAYQEIVNQKTVESNKPSRRKITEELQPCRKCDTPVIKIIPEKKGTGKYYYRYYLKCPKCLTMFMLESEKVYN